jgi:uncharacterized circularly permuted ATP-grasp superfamily protein/uncharacterized alpha-E superfamily protein
MNNQISLGLINNYKELISSYDEVIDSNGQIKPYWQSFFNSLEELGLEELENRNQEIINKLKENGVTYNVYGSMNGMNRPWILDPIPFIIHQTEWNSIEKGIKQRAHLLDLIYQDLYGPQLLIKNFIIPSELVYDNSGYLYPCIDIKQKVKNQLITCAFDIARGPDGKMWVLDNRTQSPSGAGYALENRSVLSKVIPEFNKYTYRSRISPYFNHLQQTVASLGTNNPNIVFLTPGPGNETYFEHAYLASYLGYTLVQGSDLLVRDGYVWLKSIDELVRIDVIIKRVDDEWCDPLELRSDSLLGVPGLLQVLRLGNVSIINPPGVSAIENHGLMAFMENACKFLLNEPLHMNSVATWWCGQDKELQHVLANLPKLIIKKANRKQGFKSIYGRTLNNQQLDDLRNLIRSNPKDFVAQEEVSLSTTPSYVNGKIEPRYAAMRTYLISDGEDYKVMQGGLTRSSAIKDKFVISSQFGGLSKDTWIVSDYAIQTNENFALKITGHNSLSQSLTSRNAENLFWVGRMCERSLCLTYFIRNLIDRYIENINDNEKQPEYFVVLLSALTHLTQTYPGFIDEEHEELLTNPSPELLSLIFDVKKNGSIAFNIQSLLNSINQVSDRWNYGTRKIIYRLEDSLSNIFNDKANYNLSKATKILDKLYIRLFAFNGNVIETLPKDHGYNLFEIGKNTERILALVSVLRTSFSFKNKAEDEYLLMESILENNYLLASYRSIYKSQLSLNTVLSMIFLDNNLPNTLSYLLDNLSLSLQKLPKSAQSNRLNAVEKTVLEALAKVKLINTEELIKSDEENDYREDFDNVLKDVYDLISSVSSGLSSLYFNHSVLQSSFTDNTEKPFLDEI